MLGKRLIKKHRELQEVLERLFNPNYRLDPRTRHALERRAEALFECVDDVQKGLLEERAKLQNLAKAAKKRKL